MRAVAALSAAFGAALALVLAPGLDAAPAAPPGASRPSKQARRPAEPAKAPQAPKAPAAPDSRGTPPSDAAEASSETSPDEAPRAFLIYLQDGREPIVVDRYVEADGQIRFEKYGGTIGIPAYEVLRIVPDVPGSPPSPATALPLPDPGNAPRGPRLEGPLLVTLQGGGNLKATKVEPEGDTDRVRVSVPDGSFTVPRAEILGMVRFPPGPETPEAWILIVATKRPEDAPAPAPRLPVPTPSPTDARAEAPAPGGGTPFPSGSDGPGPGSRPGLPYQTSDRPHFVRLSNGRVLRVEGFWVEDGQLKFQRFGGIIGVALLEIARLLPEEIAPVRGRIQVHFGRRLGPDLLEVRVRSGRQRVRLLGVAAVDGAADAAGSESPWALLEDGTIVHLEFDRQRYDAEGNWLAYVFLPNYRMLNAELIRLGLAQPVVDGRNVRYVDLFHELAAGDLRDAVITSRAD